MMGLMFEMFAMHLLFLCVVEHYLLSLAIAQMYFYLFHVTLNTSFVFEYDFDSIRKLIFSMCRQ